MNAIPPKSALDEAFRARPVPADPELTAAYFRKVASYEANRLRSAERRARLGLVLGAVGVVVGLAGIGTAAALAPLKTVVPLVIRVDNATGAVERVHDVRGGEMAATDATIRYFLWQYVRNRQSYAAAEAPALFDAVALMSAPRVAEEYATAFRGSNPASPQVLLGRDGSATVRWVSTSLLGPRLAQIRFVQVERRGGVPLPEKRMVATIGFDFAPGGLPSSALNVNPLGFVVTTYRADMEAPG